MQRVAVFVDAGYLFAQGSTALAGSKALRADLSLSARSVIEELKGVAKLKAASCSLLRIYWYDGALTGTPMTADQASIADLDDTKLRLGFVNSHGQQKGVDSLIVTDMIELARQKAISDAILMSGDEDVRIGVQIAQNYGVRVHLLGIAPARGSQARTLRQEADTTTQWDAVTVAKFLSIRSPVTLSSGAIASASSDELTAPKVSKKIGSDFLQDAILAFVSTLEAADVVAVQAFWKTDRGIPPEFDKRLLAQVGNAIGRRLEKSEVRQMRALFRVEVLKRTELTR